MVLRTKYIKVIEETIREAVVTFSNTCIFFNVQVPGETVIQAPVCPVSLIIACLYVFYCVLLSVLIFLVSVYLFFTGLCLN